MCNGENHFAAKCPQNPIHQVVQQPENRDDNGPDSELDGDIGLIRVVDHRVAPVSAYHKARLWIQGQDKAFLLDTGATANLISTHDVAVHKLKLTTPGRVFTMWNGSKQTALGSAPIKVYNPKTKQNFNVLFDIVSDKLTPILGCTAVQAMGLVTMATDRYDSVAAVTQSIKSKQDYITQYPDVFDKPVGTFDGSVALQVDRDITLTVSPARSLPLDTS